MNNVISDNRFLKVLIASQRAKQIHKGARPLVQKSNTRATRIAIEEVERGLISFEFILQNPDLKSGRDNRDVSGNDDDDGGVNREVTNQLSVSMLLSVARPSD
jgi:DNA-directed RNA polymerase subunit omega